ncbi:DUF2567 domain-containing protein [Rhodococcus sp. 1R11]|uniref:DUF2567 domain-containing protein n=1 Tax=Rhodococcus sp. 1R11 TaxID=2559614 RepID=UPI001072782B|nr:DUF2567 domain-containing protein [Rhodococcus sp. 1R11]TFI45169.1 DUF2567 domain-containing protein [Rhodococcus sp. 1R11]
MTSSPAVETPERRGTLRFVALVGGVTIALSAVGGLLWGLLAPSQQLLVFAQDRGATLTGESLHRFDALALFVLVSFALGILVPIGWWLWISQRGPRLFVAVLTGSLIGSVAAMLVGNGVAALRFPRADEPAVGSIVRVAPSIDTPTVLIVQALTASLVILLLAAMNPNDDLQHPDSDPAFDEIDFEVSPPPPSFDSRVPD